jgi:hypothetical protein
LPFLRAALKFGVPPPRRGLVRRLRPRHPFLTPWDPSAPRPDHRPNVAAGPQPPSGQQHHGLTSNTQEV